MTAPAPAPDYRVDLAGRCGVTRTTGRVEWICIAYAHDDPPRPGHGHRSTQPRAPGYYPRSERHHFVRRYPEVPPA